MAIQKISGVLMIFCLFDCTSAAAGRHRRRRACPGGQLECGSFVDGSSEVSDCAYGHRQKDGNCDDPCSGVKRSPCVCLDEAAAGDSIRSDGYKAIGISAAIIVVGAFCSYQFWLRSFIIRRMASASPPEEQGGSPPDGVGAIAASPDQPKPKKVKRSRSRAEVAVQSSVQLAERNPMQMNVFFFLTPLAAMGGVSYGLYKLLTSEHPFYDKYESFMGLISIASILTLIVGNIAIRLRKMKCKPCWVDSVDNPVLIIWHAIFHLFFLAPIIGLVGVGWGLYRVISPGGIYVDDCQGILR